MINFLKLRFITNHNIWSGLKIHDRLIVRHFQAIKDELVVFNSLSFTNEWKLRTDKLNSKDSIALLSYYFETVTQLTHHLTVNTDSTK